MTLHDLEVKSEAFCTPLDPPLIGEGEGGGTFSPKLDKVSEPFISMFVGGMLYYIIHLSKFDPALTSKRVSTMHTSGSPDWKQRSTTDSHSCWSDLISIEKDIDRILPTFIKI